jgi:hypothetical protein
VPGQVGEDGFARSSGGQWNFFAFFQNVADVPCSGDCSSYVGYFGFRVVEGQGGGFARYCTEFAQILVH